MSQDLRNPWLDGVCEKRGDDVDGVGAAVLAWLEYQPPVDEIVDSVGEQEDLAIGPPHRPVKVREADGG